MTRVQVGVTVLSLSVAALATFGCSEENPNEIGTGAPGGMTGSGGPGPGPVGQGNSNPKIKEVMVKVGRGPQALQGSLGDALKQADPAWDTIQGKAREYSQLTSELGKHDPVKGS